MKSLLILATLASAGLSALALSPDTQTTLKKDGHEVVIVAPTTKFIESKSLNPDGSLELRIMGAASARQLNEGQTGIGSDPWAIASPASAGTADCNLDANKDDLPNAETYYKFVLMPQEKLKLNLDCERPGMITMLFLTPPHPEASMAAQFRKANQASKPTRTHTAAIQNVTNHPYVVYLLMQGQANYGFKLGIERNGGLTPPKAETKS